MDSELTTSPGVVSEPPLPDHSSSQPHSDGISGARPSEFAGATVADRIGETLASQIRSRFLGDASREVLRFEADLEPASLGRIRVELSWDSGRVLGRLVVFTEAARQVIEHQLPALQYELNKIGIPIGQIDVTPDPNAGQEKPDQRDACQDPPTSKAPMRLRTRAAPAKPRSQNAERIDLWA